MKNKFLVCFVGLLLVLLGAHIGGCNVNLGHNKTTTTTAISFAPQNKLKIPVFQGLDGGGLTEKTFNRVIDNFIAVYDPIVKKAGFTLKINRLWDDSTVNSDTSQVGTTIIVNSYGGLARYNGMTPDAFTLVLAHEISHSLGGYPLYSSAQWASTEGQSDYSATLKVFHYMFQNDDNQSVVEGLKVPNSVANKCSKSYNTNNTIALCERSAMAGFTVAEILRQLGGEPKEVSFDTPDTSVVSKTVEGHPDGQCRLDTYFSGALCPVDYHTPVSRTESKSGSCSEQNGDSVGLRPKCWFKPE